MVREAPRPEEAKVWHNLHSDRPEVVRDHCSYLQTTRSWHLTEKAKSNCVPSKHIHLSLLEGAKDEVNSHAFSRSVLIHTLTSGMAARSFHKMNSNHPAPSKISSCCWQYREGSTKPNINISHSKQVTQCEFQEQSAYISPEFMPMTRPLEQLITIALMASPRRMYWLLLALKRCSKDQNNKIKWKEPLQGWKASAQWRLNWSCVQGTFPTESCMWALHSPEHQAMRDSGEVRTTYAIFKAAYISPKEGCCYRQILRLSFKDTSSYREYHCCVVLPILK
jgi:hypothetical protein